MKRLLPFLLIGSSFASCPNLYPNKVEFAIPNTIELCNSFFVIRYDPSNKTPVFVAEYLRKGTAVGQFNRNDSFRADHRVVDGPTLSDYSNSGYDRGHLVPSDDASSIQEMRDTFLLTNMTPQAPILNRTQWAKLESVVRKEFSMNNMDMRVITIPDFTASSALVKQRLPVPSGYWKIVIRGNKETFYYASNKNEEKVKKVPNFDWKQRNYAIQKIQFTK